LRLLLAASPAEEQANRFVHPTLSHQRHFLRRTAESRFTVEKFTFAKSTASTTIAAFVSRHMNCEVAMIPSWHRSEHKAERHRVYDNRESSMG
jgi:hypothetical protein